MVQQAPAGEPLVRAADPPSLGVTVGPGQVTRADGAVVAVPEARLSFDRPEMRDGSAQRKSPADYADRLEAWDVWPRAAGAGGAPGTLDLSPPRDVDGTLILGGLYRSVVPESVRITTADGSKTFKAGDDYKYNAAWAQVANLNGRLGAPGAADLRATYQFATQRLDLVQIDRAGKVSVKRGAPVLVCPVLAAPDAGCEAVAGVYVAPWKHGADYAITPECIFPIQPAEPVAPVNPAALAAARQILSERRELKIAFLGDSVTLGAESGKWWDGLWTEQNLGYPSRVVVGLRRQFPGATVTPLAAFKGGITTKVAMGMLEQTVLPAKADLLVIAFGLNDASGPIGAPPANPPEAYKEQVRALIRKAKSGGAQVLLVSPLQPNPWMGNHIAERIPAYRQALLELSGEEDVGFADVYSEWMNQAQRGVPPYSQLHNWINHPGVEGHGLYAQVILRFFAPEAARSAQSKPSSRPVPGPEPAR